ncbi:MAG: chemotaxis protein CheD [Pirellulales bacterium]
MLLEASPPKTLKIPLGGLDFASSGVVLETLLGSCVGVVVWCPVTKLSGMAHIVLFNSRGDQTAPGKYADTAVPHLRNELLRRGACSTRLLAKIAGGSTMFGERKPSDVGEMNYQAVLAGLRSFEIPLMAEHIGGRQGRIIKFHCETGKLDIYIGTKQVATL